MLSLFIFLKIDVQQVMLYCDPSMAIQEACCEIPGARVINSELIKHRKMLLYMALFEIKKMFHLVN